MNLYAVVLATLTLQNAQAEGPRKTQTFVALGGNLENWKVKIGQGVDTSLLSGSGPLLLNESPGLNTCVQGHVFEFDSPLKPIYGLSVKVQKPLRPRLTDANKGTLTVELFVVVPVKDVLIGSARTVKNRAGVGFEKVCGQNYISSIQLGGRLSQTTVYTINKNASDDYVALVQNLSFQFASGTTKEDTNFTKLTSRLNVIGQSAAVTTPAKLEVSGSGFSWVSDNEKTFDAAIALRIPALDVAALKWYATSFSEFKVAAAIPVSIGLSKYPRLKIP